MPQYKYLNTIPRKAVFKVRNKAYEKKGGIT